MTQWETAFRLDDHSPWYVWVAEITIQSVRGTAGSVMGEEVQMFLQKTYSILMQEDSYFSRVNIHIIQCDADIQEDVIISNRDEFEAFFKGYFPIYSLFT